MIKGKARLRAPRGRFQPLTRDVGVTGWRSSTGPIAHPQSETKPAAAPHDTPLTKTAADDLPRSADRSLQVPSTSKIGQAAGRPVAVSFRARTNSRSWADHPGFKRLPRRQRARRPVRIAQLKTHSRLGASRFGEAVQAAVIEETPCGSANTRRRRAVMFGHCRGCREQHGGAMAAVVIGEKLTHPVPWALTSRTQGWVHEKEERPDDAAGPPSNSAFHRWGTERRACAPGGVSSSPDRGHAGQARRLRRWLAVVDAVDAALTPQSERTSGGRSQISCCFWPHHQGDLRRSQAWTRKGNAPATSTCSGAGVNQAR